MPWPGPGGVHDAVEEGDAAEPPEGAAVAFKPFSAAGQVAVELRSAARRSRPSSAASRPPSAMRGVDGARRASTLRPPSSRPTARRRFGGRRRGGKRGQIARRPSIPPSPSRVAARSPAAATRPAAIHLGAVLGARGQRLHVRRQVALVGADRRRAPPRPPRRAPRRDGRRAGTPPAHRRAAPPRCSAARRRRNIPDRRLRGSPCRASGAACASGSVKCSEQPAVRRGRGDSPSARRSRPDSRRR